ncbi:MAG TPA: transposase, partial [Streptosporangiaceae bacterium]|nr:transposase [Streptosporangiaceae bacterium]
MPESPASPSYEELAALVAVQAAQLVEQASQLVEQAALIEALRVELAALRRAAGRDSSNSSQPPSQDGPESEAKAKAKAGKRSVAASGADPDQQQPDQQQPDQQQPGTDGPGTGTGTGDVGKRKQGGQPGHPGSGLARVAKADWTEPVEPAACADCGGSLAGAEGSVASSIQVFDLPALALTVTEYLIMKRVCSCGCVTTADLPAGVRGGPACYGPQVAAAVTWLASQDVIGVERAAEMMSALLGVDISTGYVSSCLTRLDDALTAAGFEPELKAALCESEVLGTDETPAAVTPSGAAAEAARTGAEISNPHVFSVRTMRECTGGGGDLVWFGAAGTRTKKEITAFGILDNFTGVLVRDDFGGYVSYDEVLAGVQQCLSHILRYLQDTIDIDPIEQVWATQAADALREAIHALNTARRDGTPLNPDKIARLRKDYDQAVACGISTNLSRPWPKGNHPGLVLAKRLKRKADQVWLFTTRTDVPPTNNASEGAIRGF